MESVELELNASKHGWNCSGCGLLFDSIGRPLFGGEIWVIHSNGVAWIENKPKIKYCPNCGKPVRSGYDG